MQLFKNKYTELNFYENEKIIEIISQEATSEMTEEEYKSGFLNYLKVVKKLKPNKVLSNNLKMDFSITLELQEWTNTNVFIPSLELGLNKAAFVESREMIARLSVEQTMEEAEGEKFIVDYFDNREEAWQWLISI